jgi:hypothetical protein
MFCHVMKSKTSNVRVPSLSSHGACPCLSLTFPPKKEEEVDRPIGDLEPSVFPSIVEFPMASAESHVDHN